MYDVTKADHAVNFINCLKHTKGKWRGVPFELLSWQDEIIRTLFGTVKENGYRQYNTCYCEIPKKNGKSELAAAIALYMTCGDGEWGAEVYGCASDRQQASIVFDVAVDMVDQCPALKKRIKPVMSVKRLVYKPTNSFYQVLSAEAYTKHIKSGQCDLKADGRCICRKRCPLYKDFRPWGRWSCRRGKDTACRYGGCRDYIHFGSQNKNI